jgi:hypothetical protein
VGKSINTMIDKDTVLAILDEEYSKCLDDMNDIDNGNPMLYAIAKNIAMIQTLRTRINEIS